MSKKPTPEDRLRAIEDRLEIYNLIASHPPSADTAADYYTRAVYAEDGVFDRDPHPGGNGNEAIAAMVRSPEHHAAISGGLAPFFGLPSIELARRSAGRPPHGSAPAENTLRQARPPSAPATEKENT